MASHIPNYALYGDKAQPAWLDMVHFELTHERSSLFDYEIAPYFHDGQIQLLYVTRGGGWHPILRVWVEELADCLHAGSRPGNATQSISERQNA